MQYDLFCISRKQAYALKWHIEISCRSGFEVSGNYSGKIIQSQVQRQNIISGLLLHSNILHLILKRPSTIWKQNFQKSYITQKFSFFENQLLLKVEIRPLMIGITEPQDYLNR